MNQEHKRRWCAEPGFLQSQALITDCWRGRWISTGGRYQGKIWEFRPDITPCIDTCMLWTLWRIWHADSVVGRGIPCTTYDYDVLARQRFEMFLVGFPTLDHIKRVTLGETLTWAKWRVRLWQGHGGGVAKNHLGFRCGGLSRDMTHKWSFYLHCQKTTLIQQPGLYAIYVCHGHINLHN